MKTTVLFLFSAGQTEVGDEKLAGARRHAVAHGWNLVPLIPVGRISAAFIRAAVSRLHPAGCIVDCSGGYGVQPPQLFGSVPVVYLDVPAGISRSAAGRTVSVDDAEVALAAFRELNSGLPSCVAVVEARDNVPWSRIRAKAFHAATLKKGLPCRVFHARRDETVPARAARLSAWLSALPRPCGIFAVNDTVGSEITAACRALRLHIPREISLVGADNIETRSGAGEAPFTSIRLDFERMGYVAAKMLGEEFSAFPREGKRITIGPLMVVRRKSTSGRGRHEPRIQEAVEMIRREACSGLTAESLMRRFPCSRRLFEMRFREATGHSILDEILHVRLEKAFTLLSETDIAIGAIYAYCGFESNRALDYLFHSRFKTSMREWRKRNARK